MNSFNLLRNVFEEDYFMEKNFVRREGLKREEEKLVLELEVPGCREGEVSVEVLGRRLYIRGEVRGEKVSWSYLIPYGSDEERVEAKLEAGLLRVEIPDKGRRKIL